MPGKGAHYREVVGWNNGEQEWRGMAIFTAVIRAGLIGKVIPSKALSMGILERCPGRGNTKWQAPVYLSRGYRDSLAGGGWCRDGLVGDEVWKLESRARGDPWSHWEAEKGTIRSGAEKIRTDFCLKPITLAVLLVTEMAEGQKQKQISQFWECHDCPSQDVGSSDWAGARAGSGVENVTVLWSLS